MILRVFAFLVVLFFPLVALADVSVLLSWEPSTEILGGGSVKGVLSHYRVYSCNAPIVKSTDEKISCSGNLQVFNTEVVKGDGSGIIEGQTTFGDGLQTLHFESEDFDKGSEGETWHDKDRGNNYDNVLGHPKYRQDAIDPDIRRHPWPNGNDGFVLGNGGTGEWQQYTIKVEKSGVYQPAINLSSTGSGESIVVLSIGTVGSCELKIPDTGNWNTFQVTTCNPMLIPAGTHKVRTTVNKGPVDQDWWELRGTGGSTEIMQPISYTTSATSGVFYFRVVAVTFSNKESTLSNEISYTLEAPDPVTKTPKAPILRILPSN
jgi:hypothetical protein